MAPTSGAINPRSSSLFVDPSDKANAKMNYKTWRAGQLLICFVLNNVSSTIGFPTCNLPTPPTFVSILHFLNHILYVCKWKVIQTLDPGLAKGGPNGRPKKCLKTGAKQSRDGAAWSSTWQLSVNKNEGASYFLSTYRCNLCYVMALFSACSAELWNINLILPNISTHHFIVLVLKRRRCLWGRGGGASDLGEI